MCTKIIQRKWTLFSPSFRTFFQILSNICIEIENCTNISKFLILTDPLIFLRCSIARFDLHCCELAGSDGEVCILIIVWLVGLLYQFVICCQWAAAAGPGGEKGEPGVRDLQQPPGQPDGLQREQTAGQSPAQLRQQSQARLRRWTQYHSHCHQTFLPRTFTANRGEHASEKYGTDIWDGHGEFGPLSFYFIFSALSGQ